MKLLIDGNSYLNQALLRGVDHDDGRVVTGPDGKQNNKNDCDDNGCTYQPGSQFDQMRNKGFLHTGLIVV